jgi:carboxyl-terminal processing protease
LGEYDGITAVVTREFYDRSFRGLDWPSRISSHRQTVQCSSDAKTVAAAANGLLSELHASHTGVYTRDQLEYWALESIFSSDLEAFKTNVSGIWPQRERDGWYARYVLPGSAADKAGIKLGDALISIDGRAFDPLAFRVNGSRLTLSSDGRERHTLRLKPVVESIQQSFIDATYAERNLITIGRYHVGYFHLWTGTNRLFLEAMYAAIAGFETVRVDAVIIDFRGGYGGANLDYIAALKSSAALRRVPKVLLVDDGVRSGKEWVAGVIKHEKLATLVGSRTAGAFLGGGR